MSITAKSVNPISVILGSLDFFLPFLMILSLLLPIAGCITSCFSYGSTAEKFRASPKIPLAHKHMEEGAELFRQGAFEQAAKQWAEAVRLYEKEGTSDQQSKAIFKLAQAYHSIGHHEKSQEYFEHALDLAKRSGDKIMEAKVLGSLGNSYIATGPSDRAYKCMTEGLELSRKQGESILSAVILNNLGNFYSSQKKYDEAISAYREARRLAGEEGKQCLTTVTLMNSAVISTRMENFKEAKALLDEALKLSYGLEDSHDKAFSLINIGLTYREITLHLKGTEGSILPLAVESLIEALETAEKIGDRYAKSYALGHLGALFEDKHQYQEALKLTRRAGFAAQQENAPESLYMWQWQTGRILKSLGNLDDAITSYRQACQTISPVRQGMDTAYNGRHSSSRKAVEPLHLELVDLLLQKAASIEDPVQSEPYLLEAREWVEMLKVSELQEYFQDECVTALQGEITQLDSVSQTAVIIYPILLKNRMELLVSFPNGLKRFSVPVGSDAVSEEVVRYRNTLETRTTYDYRIHSKKLYDWLILPIESHLERTAVDTLVFVPDGPLLTIPMAALHDGNEFLVSRFALAVTPSLNLTDPHPINRENISILAVGLTESIQGFPPLPFVADELKGIQGLYGTKVLLNQDFLISNIEEVLTKEPFRIVHIASHGKFNRNVDNTFLLTFDGKLTLDRLDQCVGLFRFRENPLELLTLSACETAAGDERAALGLAGVSIKAGARSALATLWYINDEASSVLVTEFYRQLQDKSLSRALALQRAQLALLGDPRYEHPGYWSPFILINNWL